MPRSSALVLAFALVAAVRAIPVDEISARNGVGGQADGGRVSAAASNCTSSSADCNMSKFSGMSLLKMASENAGNQAGLTGLSTALGSGGVPGGSELSGAGGETPGALIELDSNNLGQGGGASSGNSSGLVNPNGGQKGLKILTS